MKITISMTRGEVYYGFVYLIVQFFLLPPVISLILPFLPVEFNDAQLNFFYYLLNFSAIVLIFRKFLWQNLERIGMYPGYLFRVVLLGLARYILLNSLLGTLLMQLDPNYFNANDMAIMEMVQSELNLIAAGTIMLVPVAEECLFRGLLFGNLRKYNRVIAYLVSVTAFSVIHITGYIGVYTPMHLLIAFLSYLPAGLCLGWAYEKADTIFAPILIHAVVNAMAIYGMR